MRSVALELGGTSEQPVCPDQGNKGAGAPAPHGPARGTSCGCTGVWSQQGVRGEAPGPGPRS